MYGKSLLLLLFLLSGHIIHQKSDVGKPTRGLDDANREHLPLKMSEDGPAPEGPRLGPCLLQWEKNGATIPKSTKRYRRLAKERKAQEEAEELQALKDYIEQTFIQDSSDDGYSDHSISDESSEEDGYAPQSSHEIARGIAHDVDRSETAVDVADNNILSIEDDCAEATVIDRLSKMDCEDVSTPETSDTVDTSSESSYKSSDEESLSEEEPIDPHVQANLDDLYDTMEGERNIAPDSTQDDVINDPKDYKIGNSDITRRQGEMLVTALVTRHRGSGKLFRDTIKVIDLHLPKPEYKSMHSFLKDFPDDEYVDYFYCEGCKVILDFGDHRRMTKCPKCCKHYKKTALKREGKCFMHRPLGPQLKKFLESELFLQLRKECEESDLVNGERYKLLRELGIIGDHDITITFGTDGVTMFNMTKSNGWPFVVMINELPYRLRKKNIFLWGFWYGRGHPDMKMFLPILLADLEKLSDVGIRCTPIIYDKPVIIKVHSILCIADTPAKALVLCMHQHNGEFPCPYCLHEGETADPEKGNNSRIFKGGVSTPRTEESFLKDAEEVISTGVMVHGIKDLTELVNVSTMKLPDSCPPEYMHAQLLGVVKIFLGAWFDSPNHDEPYYLGPEKEREFNRRMKSIKVPKEITRPPCDVGSDMKASQMRNILLYYSIPCLFGLMSAKYYKHWLLFVYAMYLLSRNHVPESAIQLAEEALCLFVQGIEPLYGKKYMRFVVHLCLHTTHFVRQYGALWAWSAFPFEGYNGVLATLFHGTQYLPHQVSKLSTRLQWLRNNADLFSEPGVSIAAKELFMTLMGECQISNIIEYGDDLRALGKGQPKHLSMVEKNAVENILGQSIKEAYHHHDRFIQSNVLFTTSQYTRAEIRANHSVLMKSGEFVDIYALARVTFLCSGEESYVILGNKMVIQEEDLITNGKFHSNDICSVVVKSSEIVCHEVGAILSKCVSVPLKNNKICMTPIANTFETD